MSINPKSILSARKALTHYMIAKAARITRDTGLGYQAQAEAPSSYTELFAAFQHARQTAAPLPVFSGCSDSTIYTYPEGNYSFRFWHDLLHIIHNKGFSHTDEAYINQIMLKDIEAAFGLDSIEYKLIDIDTNGQNLYHMQNHCFVDKQLDFAEYILQAGTDCPSLKMQQLVRLYILVQDGTIARGF